MIKTTRSSTKAQPLILYAVIGGLSLVCAILFATTLYYRQQALSAKRTVPVVDSSASSTNDLIGEISRLITLPANEQPTIATVADPDKLKGQAFFSQAEVGDKVLIYPQAHQAILYRPSERKLISVGPFFANAATSSTRP